MGNAQHKQTQEKLKVQSVRIENDKEGESCILRSSLSPDKLITTLHDDVITLYDLWQRSVKLFPDRPCLGSRGEKDGKGLPYVFETYKEVDAKITLVASGLRTFDLTVDSKVGIYAKNRPEWVIAQEACYNQSFVCTPLYDTLGENAVKFIVNQAEIPIIICSVDKLDRLEPLIGNGCPSLKAIICMDNITDEQRAKFDSIKICTFDELMKLGAENPQKAVPPKPDTLHTICYTSGTTGNPKGVMLTHASYIAACAGVFSHGVDFTPQDVHISYLPLAHVFEGLAMQSILQGGGAVGFYRGDVTKLLDDCQALMPTIFVSVPRLFNRIFDKIRNTFDQLGGMKQSLFESGLKTKTAKLQSNRDPSSMFWDKLVFNKLKARLGSRVKVIVTGSAPLQSDVHDFLRCCFTCPLLNGYGLTETSAASCIQNMADWSSGCVGPPLPSTEIKLVDVPDMNYLSSDKPCPRGEVCIRGPGVFQGYYKMPEKTAEVLEEDGWFHTGDVGRLNANGTLTIIDRKKNIFKLSQGEYIAVEMIEGIYLCSQFIQQIFVYGDSYKSCIVAIVIPDPDVIGQYAAKNGLEGELADLCKLDQVRDAIQKDMNVLAKAEKLNGFQMVRAIHVDPEPFNVENDLITPTFKSKRPQLKKYYQEQIDDCYERAEAAAAAFAAKKKAAAAAKDDSGDKKEGKKEAE